MSQNNPEISVVQDMEAAHEVIRATGTWMRDTKKPNYSEWWNPDNIHAGNEMLDPIDPADYYAAMLGKLPVAAAVLEVNKDPLKIWTPIDGDTVTPAVYMSYIAMRPGYGSQGFIEMLFHKAEDLARHNGADRLRLDTNAESDFHTNKYQGYGFTVVGTHSDDGHAVNFFERPI